MVAFCRRLSLELFAPFFDFRADEYTFSVLWFFVSSKPISSSENTKKRVQKSVRALEQERLFKLIFRKIMVPAAAWIVIPRNDANLNDAFKLEDRDSGFFPVSKEPPSSMK